MHAEQSFVRRLRSGLGVLVGISLLGLVAVVVTEQRAGEAMQRANEALELLEAFKEVELGLADARAAELEFLLEDLRTPNFYNTGSSPALDRHAQSLAAVEERLAELDGRLLTAGTDVAGMRDSIGAYRDTFAELAGLYRERGSMYTGRIGTMRESVFGLRETLEMSDRSALKTLAGDIPDLMRDESDYLRDLDNRPRFLVTERLQVLREDVLAVEARETGEILERIGTYETAWARLIEIDDRIGRSSGDGLRGTLRSARESVVPLARAAVAQARARSDAASASVATTVKLARWASAGAALLAVTVGLLLAVSLTRQLRTSLSAVLGAVRAYAGGDRGARVGALPRRDEFAVLGSAFDRMAETLQETTEELEEINASLELAVKGDTAGLLDRIKSLVSERKPQEG